MASSEGVDDELTPPPDIVGAVSPSSGATDASFRRLAIAVKEFEKQYVVRALRLSNGGKGEAASLLGISRKNLWEKLKLHGISDDDDEGRLHG